MSPDVDTIERIYTGGWSDPPWQGVVEMLVERLGALIVALAFRTREDDEPAIAVRAFRGSGEAVWLGYFDRHSDAVRFNFGSLAPGRFHDLSAVTDTSSPVFKQLQREVHTPLGVGQVSCMALEHEGVTVAHLLCACTDPLSAEQRDWCEALAAPLARALAAYHRMRVAELSSMLAGDALDRLEIGVLAIDSQDRIVFSNAMAQRLLAECRSMSNQGGRLSVSGAALLAKLRASRSSAQATRLRGQGDSMIGLLMTPVLGGRDELGPRLRPDRALYLHGVARAEPIAEATLVDLFELSPTQARLASLLCAGLTLREVATRLNVTENTTRTYSKQVFAKLGVTRQPDLVRLLLSSVARLGALHPGADRAAARSTRHPFPADPTNTP